MRGQHVLVDVIAEHFDVSRATASRWTAGVLPRPTACRVEWCEAPPPYVRGFCGKHYARFRRHGDATVVRAVRSETEPLPLAAKAYLAAFERWLREPTEANRTFRHAALGELLGTKD